MPLNVKDPEAHKLAKALHRLERVRRRRKREATAEELLSIGRRCASTLKGPAVDHGTLLYDERGLPR